MYLQQQWIWNNNRGVYSGELELKNKNEDPCKVSLLDISTEVYDKKVTTELFE